MDYKIEYALQRLKKNVEKHKKNDLIQFEGEILRINKNSSGKWVILFYIIFLIILPIGLLINVILYKNDYWIIGLLILSISTFISSLRKITIGDNTLDINIKEKYFEIENNHFLLKRMLKSRKINFSNVAKSDLTERTIYHRQSSKSRWLQLSINDIKGRKYILTDFDINYPDSSIAKDVKSIIDSTILKNKKC